MVPGLLFAVEPALVQAACQGDALAIDELLNDLLPMIRRLATAVAPSTAEDATQEALILVFRNLRNLKDPEAIVAWTRKLTVRAAIRLAQANRKHTNVERGVPAQHPTADEHVVDLADALKQLPLEQRIVVALCALEGLTEREVAAALALPIGTVKSRLHRARTKLRQDWNK